MSDTQFTREEEIELTNATLQSSYDLVNTCLLPQIHLLEDILNGEKLSKDREGTFAEFYHIGLWVIPRIHIGCFPGDEKKAIGYYESALWNELDDKIKRVSEFVHEGEPPYFTPNTVEEIDDLITRCSQYLSENPRSAKQWGSTELPGNIYDFIDMVSQEGGVWTEEGKKEMTKWFSGSYFQKAVEVHILKLDIMTQVLEYAIRKADELGCADTKVFNPETYLTGPSLLPIWKEYFPESIPSPVELLDLAKKVLTSAKEKYSKTE